MKVVGKINNQKVIVLLDTGATHNFLNSRLAHLVEGKTTPQASFNVMVGTGAKQSCNDICKNVNLEMHKERKGLAVGTRVDRSRRLYRGGKKGTRLSVRGSIVPGTFTGGNQPKGYVYH
ncbi:hypothetical protein EJ110_NYTH27905 [Nymphaea thermarum]|nr:hypothetical protein EJ110_NYTH27905 [Nymphaea thermarum]